MPASQDRDESPIRISDRLYELCRSSESVSSLVANDPSLAPGDAWKRLYGDYDGIRGRDISNIGRRPISDKELRRARECGRWGPQEPSDLFLRIYHDALCMLDDDLAGGTVSPPLMGTCGTVPLTIFSVIPDIVRHMSNLIVRAEKEVFLVTNYWANGVAARYIANALRELSRRVGHREGPRVVVKILYDRGSVRQLLEPHLVVSEDEFAGEAVGLPTRREIEHIDLAVANYHQPLLGTAHAKYMVVDRRVAVIQSNNIQDSDNIEMMVQVEGPAVDTLYDMALLTWHRILDPPLPMRNSSATAAYESGDRGSFGKSHADIFGPGGTIKGYPVVVDPAYMPTENYDLAAIHPRNETSGEEEAVRSRRPATGATVPSSYGDVDGHVAAKSQEDVADLTHIETEDAAATADALPEHTADDPHYDATLAGEIQRVQASLLPRRGETQQEVLTRHLNHTVNVGFSPPAPAPRATPLSAKDAMTPYIPHAPHAPFPMALVCRPPNGAPGGRGPASAAVKNPQDAAWLAAVRRARESVLVQTPTLNAGPLIEALAEACERGVDVYCYVCLGYNDAGELLPFQGGHNEGVAHRLHTSPELLSSPAAKARLHWHWYVAADQTAPLPATSIFPAPGSPSHPAPYRRRSCHVKLLVVDSQVAVVGSGNQDAQSWYHSQEANLLLDFAPRPRAPLSRPPSPSSPSSSSAASGPPPSGDGGQQPAEARGGAHEDDPGALSPAATVCRAWIDAAVRRAQNTARCGAVDPQDGVWRAPARSGGSGGSDGGQEGGGAEEERREASGATGVDPGRFSWARGIMGAVRRVRGEGGF
ncbi:hypothetical protein GGS23DRAFT_602946 [Durotheca rogersii]|uniref:uncharacterized protein n=1 Tax=Durotheca rogersii TaxID=419775 RepID=UPI00221F2B00|nr:uncharacterized protein GGS23DRAFT_602946 [Durotheca rogersii]KAI5866689.1 hypothetical protein GGS23DRAFT_602946 [Durotheca rogersii]